MYRSQSGMADVFMSLFNLSIGFAFFFVVMTFLQSVLWNHVF
ncbi:MAG TPA: hypothetical protein V6C72_08865 [Chroococcales cyanobacterium]